MVGEGLTRPFPRDQHAAAAEAEGFPPVGLARAPPRRQPGLRVLRLYPVAQPVRTRRRARLEPQSVGKPLDMRTLHVGGDVVTGIQRLGRIPGQVADQPAGVAAGGGHPVRADLHPEPDHRRPTRSCWPPPVSADSGHGPCPLGLDAWLPASSRRPNFRPATLAVQSCFSTPPGLSMRPIHLRGHPPSPNMGVRSNPGRSTHPCFAWNISLM